jgi:hypothetical protein
MLTMEAGMPEQFGQVLNWDNLPDNVKITQLRDQADSLTTQLHQLNTQVQQLASVSARTQALLNALDTRADGSVELRQNLSVVNGADILLE